MTLRKYRMAASKVKCGHDASFEGEEVDVIAASDIFGGHGRYEKLQISYYWRGVVSMSSCSRHANQNCLSRPRAGGSLGDEPGK